MKLKKPKFWDLKKPNFYSYILFPITILVKFVNYLNIIFNKPNLNKANIILPESYNSIALKWQIKEL